MSTVLLVTMGMPSVPRAAENAIVIRVAQTPVITGPEGVIASQESQALTVTAVRSVTMDSAVAMDAGGACAAWPL